MTKNKSYVYSLKTYIEYNLFCDYKSDFEIYNDKRHDIKESKISYRNINYWESVGVLDDMREVTGKGWRKFSDIDLAFIAIISQLRKIGMPLDKIKKVKESLSNYWIVDDIEADVNDVSLLEKYMRIKLSKSKKKDMVNLLEFAFIRIMFSNANCCQKYVINNKSRYDEVNSTNNGNTYLLIDDDGDVAIMTECDLHINQVENTLPNNYYYLNLNALLKEWLGPKFEIKVEESKSMISSFSKVYNALINNKIVSLNFNKKNQILEQKFKISEEDLKNIDNFQYGKIQIAKHAGNTTSITATITEKLK